MAIGIGERGARRGLDPQMTQLAFTALQAPCTCAQRVRTTQLTEQHRHELAPMLTPLAPRSAPVFCTSLSKSTRGTSLSIWLNMLHDAFTLGLLRLGPGGFGDSPVPYIEGRPNVMNL